MNIRELVMPWHGLAFGGFLSILPAIAVFSYHDQTAATPVAKMETAIPGTQGAMLLCDVERGGFNNDLRAICKVETPQ